MALTTIWIEEHECIITREFVQMPPADGEFEGIKYMFLREDESWRELIGRTVLYARKNMCRHHSERIVLKWKDVPYELKKRLEAVDAT